MDTSVWEAKPLKGEGKTLYCATITWGTLAEHRYVFAVSKAIARRVIEGELAHLPDWGKAFVEIREAAVYQDTSLPATTGILYSIKGTEP